MPERHRSYSTNTFYQDHDIPTNVGGPLSRPVSQLSQLSRLSLKSRKSRAVLTPGTNDENFAEEVKVKEWDGVHPRDFLLAHRHQRSTDKIRKPKDYDNNPRRVKDHETFIEAAERKRVSAIMMERQRVSDLRKVGAGRIRESFIQRRMENEERHMHIMKGKSPGGTRRSRSVTPFFMRGIYENEDEQQQVIDRRMSTVTTRFPALVATPTVVTSTKHPDAIGSAYKADVQLQDLDEFERRLIYIHNTTKEDRIRERMAQVR